MTDDMPQCNLRHAVEDLIDAVGHVFGHCFQESTAGTISYFRMLDDEDPSSDLEDVEVSFDPSSLVVTCQRPHHRMTLTFNSYLMTGEVVAGEFQ